MIDYKKPDTKICIIDKITKEVIVSGRISSIKEFPELLISFDDKYYFATRKNSLYYMIEQHSENIEVGFDQEKYKEKILPYKSMQFRKDPNELIFREYNIDELDPEIAQLVYTLNDLGYKTTSSCCGHGVYRAWVTIAFERFEDIRVITKIIEREDFRHDFILGTKKEIFNTTAEEVWLTLQTTKIGNEAYKDIDRLTDYLSKMKE